MRFLDLAGVRLATPEDNPALLGLLRAVHMPADLDMTMERDPDFFALPRLHSDTSATLVLEIDHRPEAMLSLVVRDGYLRGEVKRVGYICDIRATRKASRSRLLSRFTGEGLQALAQQYKLEASYFAMIDTNRLARRSLIERVGMMGFGQVFPHCSYEMVNVQLCLWPGGAGDAGPMREHERDEVFDFWQKGQKSRIFGYALGRDAWIARFGQWLGLGWGDVVVARAGGRVVGMAVLWDSGRVKRTRVLGYHNELATIKTWYDRGSRLFGYPALPDPGGCFRFKYLTQLEVLDDDPAILARLLRACWVLTRPERLHFLSVMVPIKSKLQNAFSGFYCNRTLMSLFAAVPSQSPYTERDFLTDRPGFEMGLV